MEDAYSLALYYMNKLIPIKEHSKKEDSLLTFRGAISGGLANWQYLNENIKDINKVRIELYYNNKLIKEYSPVKLKDYVINPDKSIIFERDYLIGIYRGMSLLNSNVLHELYVTGKGRKPLNELRNLITRIPKYLKAEDSLDGLDYMMAPVIESLNSKGIETVFSCDGHFKTGAEIYFKGFIDPKCFIATEFYLRYITNINGVNLTKIKSKRPENAIEHISNFSKFVEIVLNINYKYITLSELNGYPYTNVYDRSYHKKIKILSKDAKGVTLENGTILESDEIEHITKNYGSLDFKLIDNHMNIF